MTRYNEQKAHKLSCTYAESGIKSLHKAAGAELIGWYSVFVSNEQHKFIERLLHLLAPLVSSLHSNNAFF